MSGGFPSGPKFNPVGNIFYPVGNIRYILWVTLKLYPVGGILWITLKLYPVGYILWVTLKLYPVGNMSDTYSKPQKCNVFVASTCR